MPIELRKLKKMLTPQVTGRVGSNPCRWSVIACVSAMPLGWAVSLTSLPVEYRTTLGWLRSLRTMSFRSRRHQSLK